MVQDSEKIKPKGAWLNVNRRCNFRCKWCYGQGTDFDAEKEMTLPFATEMAELLANAGVKKLIIIGGEPTLWEPLTEFNAICHSLGLETTVVTNALRFSDDAFWEKYIKSPSTVVNISLKAGSYEQLLEVAGVRCHESVEKALRRTLEHFDTGVGITYNSFYVNNLTEMAEFAMKCGARFLKVDFCTPVFIEGEPSDTFVVEPHQTAANIVRDYPKLDEITGGRLGFEMSVPLCLWPEGFIAELKAKGQIGSVCSVVKREGIVISHDGQLLMCNELFDFPMGRYGVDFQDGDSSIRLLNSEEISGYYNQISRYPSNACQECLWYADCGGGCPLRWAVYQPEQIVKPILEKGGKASEQIVTKAESSWLSSEPSSFGDYSPEPSPEMRQLLRWTM